MTIDYNFKNKKLLKEALTHGSLKKGKKLKDNERLEFLGDAVLSLVITEWLLSAFPEEPEGELARRRSVLVSGEILTEIAKNLSLGAMLHLSESEASSGGRERASNLEDVMEALIGAIYLDGGLDEARGVILAHWQKQFYSSKNPPKDAKTALQEWAQARGLPLPKYQLVKSSGPSHAPLFTVEVGVETLPTLQASGTTKKQAEMLAAQTLLSKINN